MSKKILAVALSLLSFSLILTACKKQVENEPKGTSQPNAESATVTLTDSVITTTSPRESSTCIPDENAVSDPTVWIENCETPETDEVAVSDPTRVNVQNIHTTISTPEKITFYSEGKENSLSSSIVEDVVEEINEELTENYFSQLKLAVTSQMIENCKKNNTCVELQFDSLQVLHENCDCIEPHPYYFEKILIVLDGDYKGVLFFEKDGQYQNGPIKFSQSDIAEDILKEILDE